VTLVDLEKKNMKRSGRGRGGSGQVIITDDPRGMAIVPGRSFKGCKDPV
jgi:hypothetical protein